jgi:AP2 domain
MPRPTRRPYLAGPLAVIPLTQGLAATVDATDLPLAEGRLWYAQRIGKLIYACSNSKGRGPGKRGKLIYLHRVILGEDVAKIDHRDGNGLNCTRNNLRPATHQQNVQNRGAPSNNRSGHPGVCWDKAVSRWKAYVRTDGKQQHLGYFDAKEEAVAARVEAARKAHGEFYRETPLPSRPTLIWD